MSHGQSVLSRYCSNNDDIFRQCKAVSYFQRDIPDLAVDAEKTYQFPSNDEDFGMVYMGWRVPGNLVKSMQKRCTQF